MPEVVGPLLHQRSALLKQVRAHIRLLDLRSHRVRQCQLHRRVGSSGLLLRPVPEAGPKAVNGRPFREAVVPQKLGERHVRERLARLSGRWEYQLGFVSDRIRLFKHLDGGVRQWHPMRPARFHPVTQNRPQRRVRVDFVPRRGPRLSTATRRQHYEPEAELRRLGRPDASITSNASGTSWYGSARWSIIAPPLTLYWVTLPRTLPHHHLKARQG